MKRKLVLSVTIMLGVTGGYIETNLFGETNLLQKFGVIPDGPDIGLIGVLVGIFIFFVFSLGTGYAIWSIFRMLMPSISK